MDGSLEVMPEAVDAILAEVLPRPWAFTERVVADAFKGLLIDYPELSSGVEVRFEPMP